MKDGIRLYKYIKIIGENPEKETRNLITIIEYKNISLKQ